MPSPEIRVIEIGLPILTAVGLYRFILREVIAAYQETRMAVGFLSEEEQSKIRIARLREMTDDDLRAHGQALRRLAVSPNKNVPAPEGFVQQLKEAREEWRRRHPH